MYSQFQYPKGYTDWLFALFEQLLLNSNRSNKFMEPITYCFTFWFHQFCRYLINNWWYLSFKPFNSRLNLKDIGLNYKWISCIYYTRPKIIFLFAYSNDDTSEFSSYTRHGGGNLQGEYLHHCYEVTCGLVTLLTFTNASSQVSDVLPLRSFLPRSATLSFRYPLYSFPNFLLASRLTLLR